MSSIPVLEAAWSLGHAALVALATVAFATALVGIYHWGKRS